MAPSAHTWKSNSKVTYSVNDMMSALCISRKTLYDLINEQKLRTYKIGRRRFCTHEALLECQHQLEADTAA